MDASLPVYRQFVGHEPDFHVTYGALGVAAIGNFLVIAGPDEALAPVRGSHGTIVVDDLEDTQRFLEGVGATITQPYTEGPTGASVHARHPDDNTFEYVQWTPEYVERIVRRA